MGTLHGGILRDIADAAMGMAFAGTLAPEEYFHGRTQNQFPSSCLAGSLKAEGIVVQRGRTMGYVECSITDDENSIVAKAASTCMVLRGQKASGR